MLLEEDGQTLVEYGLLVSLIAIVSIAILAVFGRKIRDVFVQLNTRTASTA
jgi:pilus assembly protein Flp/PilA